MGDDVCLEVAFFPVHHGQYRAEREGNHDTAHTLPVMPERKQHQWQPKVEQRIFRDAPEALHQITAITNFFDDPCAQNHQRNGPQGYVFVTGRFATLAKRNAAGLQQKYCGRSHRKTGDQTDQRPKQRFTPMPVVQSDGIQSEAFSFYNQQQQQTGQGEDGGFAHQHPVVLQRAFADQLVGNENQNRNAQQRQGNAQPGKGANRGRRWFHFVENFISSGKATTRQGGSNRFWTIREFPPSKPDFHPIIYCDKSGFNDLMDCNALILI
jgi:hypothetical protein